MDCGIINWLLKFADDTKLFGKVQSELDNKSLQGDLQRLFDWVKEWQMKFNIDKCKVMHMGNSSKNFKYYMDNKELEMVQEKKDLRVLITTITESSTDPPTHRPCHRPYHYPPTDSELMTHRPLPPNSR